MPRRTVAEAAQTREDVLAAARQLFADRGYHHVSVPEIAKAAGVTHGALYHHFANKQDLFRAVFDQVEHELNDAVLVAAFAETTTWDAFVAGTRLVLEVQTQHAYQQIALTDAPSVFGWQEWHTIDASIGANTLRIGLDALQQEGFLAEVDLDAFTVILFGALTQGTITLANGGSDLDADRLVDTICRMILALSPGVTPPNDRWRRDAAKRRGRR
jgi:AcrR family transcriptional regulator